MRDADGLGRSGGERRPRGYRYGRWSGGADPLAPPYDVRAAVDELGDRVMEGSSVREALRELLRDGVEGAQDRGEKTGLRGLDALREQLQRRRGALRRSGDLSGPLAAAREALDRALTDERAVLAAMDAAQAGDGADGADAGGLPSDERVLREMTLDTLPRSTAGAVRALKDYDWLSPTARETYEQLLEDLRAQALRAQLGANALGPAGGGDGQDGDAGAGESGDGAEAGADQAGTSSADLKDLLADLNTLLGKHAKGQDTPEDFAEFMAEHGDAFPEDPQDVDELIDALAQRAAAMGRLMRSLSKSQRKELASLMAQALDDADLAAEMSALSSHLQDLRPGAFGGPGERFTGDAPLDLDAGTAAIGELSDLDALDDQLSMGEPLSTLDDVDVDALERQLGPGAVAQVEALRRLERELREQGWLDGSREEDLMLSPKALRQLGQSALAKVFADLRGAGRGGHDERSAGAAGEATGASRPWSFGDEQPLDAVATVRAAVTRRAGEQAGSGAGPRGSLRLLPEDFAVVETERRTSAAVALCVDLSYSMFAEDRWASMKQTALALAHLIATRYPQDALQVIGFGRTAARLTTAQLAAVEPSMVQGTNLQHALALARQHVGRHPTSQPVVLVVTDGEPTAHLEGDGEAWFEWPTSAATLRATLTEVDAMTRARTPITTFVLGEDPGLRRFVDAVARRNGGRVMAPSPTRLGEYVVSDYLRTRAGA